MRLSTESLEATIKGKPIAWARAADRGRGGGRYTPEPYASWKALAAEVLAFSARYRELKGEVTIQIDLFPDRVEVKAQALEPTDARRAPTGLTGDIDNYAKAVLDALQKAGTIADDKAIAELRIRFRPERGEEA